MKLEEILKLFNLTQAEASNGTQSLDTLVKWTNDLIAERGRDYVVANRQGLRDEWLFIQTL
jgi:hypothetical protein